MIDLEYEFPINKRLVYLNNAAYDPVPLSVINSMNEYLIRYSTEGPDSMYVKLDELVSEARGVVASFINAEPEEIVFTQSITHGINIVAEGLSLKGSDNIILREAEREHAANFLPWLKRSTASGLKRYITGSDENGFIDLQKMESYMKDKPGGIVSVTHGLYNLGTILPVEEISRIAHTYGYLVFVDGGQTIGSTSVDVKKLGCDFLAFSGYKWLCAPPGIGVLYARKDIQPRLNYYGMDVRSIELRHEGTRTYLSFSGEGFRQRTGPYVFEAGFRNYLGIAGLVKAVTLIAEYGIENIHRNNKKLICYARELLTGLPNVKFYGPDEEDKRCSILSFNIQSKDPAELVKVVADRGFIIATREIGDVGIARISPHFFNNESQIVGLVEAIKDYVKS